MKQLFVLFAVCCACSSVMADDEFWIPNYQRTALGDSIDLSTLQVLKTIYENAENKNIVSSPLGLMMLLSLYNTGAGSGAKTELSNFLGESRLKDSSDSYKELSVKYSELNPEYLTVADKVAVSDQLTLDDSFATTARAYRSDFESFDFTKPEVAVTKINQWAAEKTKGHITEPVSKDILTPDVAVALFNIIYFKGHWHVPFIAAETKAMDFHLTRSDVVKKQMMHLFQSLYYTESSELGARLIELPYKEKGFRMVVVLPNEVDGLPSVLGKAAEKGLLTDVFRLSPAGCDVELDMPKFDIKTQIDFNDILPKVGVSKIFSEAAPGIVKETPVRVSKVFQEAFIKVDEEGATAGAFTGVVAVPMSSISRPPPPMKFTVDHPFLYAILHEDKIIFAGTYSN